MGSEQAARPGYILSYDSWIEDVEEHRRSGRHPGITTQITRSPTDPTRFQHRSAKCPFCGSLMTLEIDKSEATMAGYNDAFLTFDVRSCAGCGWWDSRWTNAEGPDSIGEVSDYTTIAMRWAIARQFDVRSAHVPLALLTREIARTPTLLYDVQPRKLEELVGAIFASVYACRVEHVGRSYDGGVDLIVVDSNNPLLVQVKRRSAPRHTEAASVVREFIGAMHLRGATRGAIVSTARAFSQLARRHAATITRTRRFEYFELVDFDRLRSMLRLLPPTRAEPWRPYIAVLSRGPIPIERDDDGFWMGP